MPPKGRNDGKSSQRVPKTVPGQESGRVLAYGYKQAMKRMKYSQALVGKDLDQYQKILVSLINPNAKAMTRAFNCPEPKEGFTLSTSDGQVMEEVKTLLQSELNEEMQEAIKLPSRLELNKTIPKYFHESIEGKNGYFHTLLFLNTLEIAGLITPKYFHNIPLEEMEEWLKFQAENELYLPLLETLTSALSNYGKAKTMFDQAGSEKQSLQGAARKLSFNGDNSRGRSRSPEEKTTTPPQRESYVGADYTNNYPMTALEEENSFEDMEGFHDAYSTLLSPREQKTRKPLKSTSIAALERIKTYQANKMLPDNSRNKLGFSNNEYRLSYVNNNKPSGAFLDEFANAMMNENHAPGRQNYSAQVAQTVPRAQATIVVSVPKIEDNTWKGGSVKDAKTWLKTMSEHIRMTQPANPTKFIQHYLGGAAKDWFHVVEISISGRLTWKKFVTAFKIQYTGATENPVSKFYNTKQGSLTLYEYLLRLIRLKDESGLQISDVDLIKQYILNTNPKDRQTALRAVYDKHSVQEVLRAFQAKNAIALEAGLQTNERGHSVNFGELLDKDEETEVATQVNIPTFAPVPTTENLFSQLKTYVDQQIFTMQQQHEKVEINKPIHSCCANINTGMHAANATMQGNYGFPPNIPGFQWTLQPSNGNNVTTTPPQVEEPSQEYATNATSSGKEEMICSVCGLTGHTKLYCYSRCRLCDQSHKKPGDLCEAAKWLANNKKNLVSMFGNDLPEWFDTMMKNLNMEGHQ